MGAGDYVQTAFLHGRMQKGPGGAHPPAVVDGALGIGHTFLGGAVVIGVARDAAGFGAVHEGFTKLVGHVRVGDGQRAVPVAEPFVGLTDAFFRAFEVGQHVGIAPAPVAHLGPGIVILAVAAVVDVAVDGRRSAQGLAARHGNGAAGGPFRRLRLIAPVQRLVVQQFHEARRNMDHGVPIGRPRFQHADRIPAVRRKPIGQHAARRSGADDDVVVCVHKRSSTWMKSGTGFAPLEAPRKPHHGGARQGAIQHIGVWNFPCQYRGTTWGFCRAADFR